MNLPRYQCHKIVQALKIKAIQKPSRPIDQEDDGERILTFSDEGFEGLAFGVDHAYMRKHQPQPGGYYVVYEDDYRSFSPSEAFEAGYTRIES